MKTNHETSYNPTHKELIKRGAIWLKNSERCSVVLLERNSGPDCSESPDLIGWKNWHSTLIEVKISRADFLKDKKKMFRRIAKRGMGRSRYYLCPKGLIQPDEIPEKWGLLWANEYQIRRKVAPGGFELSDMAQKHEMGMLTKALRNITWAAMIVPDPEKEQQLKLF